MAENTLDSAPALRETGFIRQRELMGILPFSRTTLWRMVKDGTFPAPIKLSAGVTAWQVEAVRAWVDQRSGLALTTGRHEPAADDSRKVDRPLKQRATANASRPTCPASNKALERELVAEAKAWSDAAAIRAYVSHLLAAAIASGDRPDPGQLDWLVWATDVATRIDPAPGRLMKLAKSEAGGA